MKMKRKEVSCMTDKDASVNIIDDTYDTLGRSELSKKNANVYGYGSKHALDIS